MRSTSQKTFYSSVSASSTFLCPPGFPVYPYIYYWQIDQSPQFTVCLLCNAIHEADPVVNKGSLSLVIHNIPLANCSSDWPIDNTAPLYTNLHPVAVHKLCAIWPKSHVTGCFSTPLSLYPCQQLLTFQIPSSITPSLLQQCSTSIPTMPLEGSSNMNFTIPSQARLNIATNKQTPPHNTLLPTLVEEEVPTDSSLSSLDSRVQETILATSLRHLQHDFHLPLPPTTTPHHTSRPTSPSNQSSSQPLTPQPSTPQQSEWGTPYLLLHPPSSPTSSHPAIAQPPPPAPPRAAKLTTKPPPVPRSKPLTISQPAWRRVSRWITAIYTFLDMQQSKDKPEPAVAQKNSREMVEAIKEVEEEKGLMSYDIILGTELYQTVRRLADANVNGRKNQPSNLAKGVLECWAGRFPGMLPQQGDGDGDEGMDVDE